MAKPVGRWVPLSPFRLLVADMMRFALRTPAVTAERRMDLGVLAAARAASPRVSISRSSGWARTVAMGIPRLIGARA